MIWYRLLCDDLDERWWSRWVQIYQGVIAWCVVCSQSLKGSPPHDTEGVDIGNQSICIVRPLFDVVSSTMLLMSWNVNVSNYFSFRRCMYDWYHSFWYVLFIESVMGRCCVCVCICVCVCVCVCCFGRVVSRNQTRKFGTRHCSRNSSGIGNDIRMNYWSSNWLQLLAAAFCESFNLKLRRLDYDCMIQIWNRYSTSEVAGKQRVMSHRRTGCS